MAKSLCRNIHSFLSPASVNMIMYGCTCSTWIYKYVDCRMLVKMTMRMADTDSQKTISTSNILGQNFTYEIVQI